MAELLLDMQEAQLRGPPPLRSDARLAALLRSGAAKEILERLNWLQEQDVALHMAFRGCLRGHLMGF